MSKEPTKRGRGRPAKYKLDPLPAPALDIAQAIFRAADKPGKGRKIQEPDSGGSPVAV